MLGAGTRSTPSAGSAARVEIGDAASYDACTNLVLALPVSWSADVISVELQGNNDLTSFDGAYIYIHNADNLLVGSPLAITAAP